MSPCANALHSAHHLHLSGLAELIAHTLVWIASMVLLTEFSCDANKRIASYWKNLPTLKHCDHFICCLNFFACNFFPLVLLHAFFHTFLSVVSFCLYFCIYVYFSFPFNLKPFFVFFFHFSHPFHFHFTVAKNGSWHRLQNGSKAQVFPWLLMSYHQQQQIFYIFVTRQDTSLHQEHFRSAFAHSA